MNLLRNIKKIGGGATPSLTLDLTRFWGGCETDLKNKSSYFSAFTLAEMMVVMLILSIVLAAMAPVMTTRNKPNNSSPWKYEGNLRQNAWFGAGAAQKAMIGQSETKTGDIATKLQITLGSGDTTTSLLAFKRGDTQLGRLYMSSDQLLLGNLSSGNLGSGAVVIGRNLQAGTNSTGLGSTVTATGNNSTAVGSTVTASGANSIAIGTSTTASGSDSIGIGNSVTASGQESTALGEHSRALTAGTTALGRYAYADSDYATAVGAGAQALLEATALGTGAGAMSNDSVAVGYSAIVPENATGAIAIGADLEVKGERAIVIGTNSARATHIVSGVDSISIGTLAVAPTNGVAIGILARGTADSSIAIGHNAEASAVGTENSSIAIGKGAIADSYYKNDSDRPGSLAIGQNAWTSYGGIAIGKNARSHLSPNSIAIGNYANTNSQKSIAIGYNVHATQLNSIAIGNDITNNRANVIQLGDDSQTVYIPGKLIVGNKSFFGANLSGHELGVAGQWGNNGKRAWLHDRDRDGFDVWKHGDNWAAPGYDGASTWINHWEPSWTTSDRRLKYVGKENTSGLDKIRQLKIFNYTYKKDTTKTPHVGVIAQDLQKVFPNAVKKGADGFLTIRMEDMFYAVINAIKELDAKYQAQEKRITALEKENKEFKARLERLEAKTK